MIKILTCRPHRDVSMTSPRWCTALPATDRPIPATPASAARRAGCAWRRGTQGWRRLDQMVTGTAPATMASGGRRRSTSGSATGGAREREKGMGRIPCSPGARWSGRGGAGRSDGDEFVHGGGGRSGKRRDRKSVV